MRDEVRRAKSEAGELAKSAAETARERGRETLEGAKERAAEQAQGVASALEATADDLEAGDGNEALSGYTRSMASIMKRFAGGLRERDIEEFAGELASFARRNPASFLAGSVALGFGVSRFLKATSQRSREEYGYDEDEEYLLEADEEGFDDTLQSGSASDEGVAGETFSGEQGRWPEDRGSERPGAGASTQHWSPAVSEPSSSASPQAASGPGSEQVTETRTERVEMRSEDIRRNEP